LALYHYAYKSEWFNNKGKSKLAISSNLVIWMKIVRFIHEAMFKQMNLILQLKLDVLNEIMKFEHTRTQI